MYVEPQAHYIEGKPSVAAARSLAEAALHMGRHREALGHIIDGKAVVSAGYRR